MTLPNRRNTAFAILAIGGALAAAASGASAYSDRVKSACTDDYLRFCPQYEVGSAKLKSCMRAQGRGLSPRCQRALVDAGLVSKKEIARYRRQ